jgi:hypothetical protein
MVNSTGPYNLNVFKFSGQKPNITADKIDVLLGDDACLKVSNVQTNTVGDLFVVRIDVASQCTTTSTPPAIMDEFPIVPVAVGASVGFCLLVTVIVVIVVCVCRRRKKAEDDGDDPLAADFASRTALTPQRDTRVPVQWHELREHAHSYEQTDDPLGDGTKPTPVGNSVYNVVSAADAAQMAPDGIYDTVGTSRKETPQYHSVGTQPAPGGNYDSVSAGRQETMQYHRVGRGANGGVGGNQEGTYDAVSGMVNAREASEYDSARFEAGERGNYHSARM